MRQRHRGVRAPDLIGDLLQAGRGPAVTQPGGLVPGPHRDRELPAALAVRAAPRAAVIAAGRSPMVANRQARAMPSSGANNADLVPCRDWRATQRHRRLGDLALVCQRGGQIHQRQRSPRVAGAVQGRRGRAEQLRGGRSLAPGQQHLRQQHLADRAAGLRQLGEVGEFPRRSGRRRRSRPFISAVVVSARPTVNRSRPGYSAPSTRSTSGATSPNRPIRPMTTPPRWPPTPPPCPVRPDGPAPRRPPRRHGATLPAFIAKVADSASRVIRDDAVAHPLPHVLQEHRCALGFRQHPELVGRPGQRPRHQLLLRQRPRRRRRRARDSASRPRPCQASA